MATNPPSTSFANSLIGMNYDDLLKQTQDGVDWQMRMAGKDYRPEYGGTSQHMPGQQFSLTGDFNNPELWTSDADYLGSDGTKNWGYQLGKGADGKVTITPKYNAPNDNMGLMLALGAMGGMFMLPGALGGLGAEAGGLASLEGAGGMTAAEELAAANIIPQGAAFVPATASEVAATYGGTAGGMFGSGISTGNALADKFLQSRITKPITSTAMNSMFGPSGPQGSNTLSTGATGTGSNMADFDWGKLFGTGLDLWGADKIAGNIQNTANTSAGNINNMASTLANQGKFTPYNVTSGFGSTSVGADGTINNILNPALQGQQDQAFGQMSNLMQPYSNQSVSDISGNAYDLSAEWLNKRANPLYSTNETKGLFGAGALLDKAGAFDPEANAKSEYDLMQQIYAPTRERAGLDMENRLMNQGRLGLSYGSIGAAPELAAMMEGNRMQDLQATKDSRQLAFDRQNNMIGQAGALNDIGIKSGAAGTAQQKAYYDMASGLFGMGMSGDKFINDMNASQINQAGALQGIGLAGNKMLMDQTGQAIQAGSARANAENAGANRTADMQSLAEKIRYAGAVNGNDIQSQVLKQAIGGAKGFLGGSGTGGGGANTLVQSLVSKLTGAGMSPEQATQYITDNWSDIVPEGTPAIAAGGDVLADTFGDFDWF